MSVRSSRLEIGTYGDISTTRPCLAVARGSRCLSVRGSDAASVDTPYKRDIYSSYA